MQKEQQLNEAVRFFKADPVYAKLFHLFRKKYESLGRVGGTVAVGDFTAPDLEIIGRFFGKPKEDIKKKGTISLREFDTQLKQTKFHTIPLHELLEAYFNEKIYSKKEQEASRLAQLRMYFEKWTTTHPGLEFWLEGLLEGKNEGRWILQMAGREPKKFSILLTHMEHAISSLPTNAERLPMFSQRITGDPHAFDLQTDQGRMFVHVLAVKRALQLGEPLAIPNSTEDVNELFESYQLYRDDLLNNVTCANLIAETEAGTHPVWKAAAQLHTVQIVPLRELVSLVTVRPAIGSKVFIVENSGVCATLLDQVPNVPIICTNGQFTLASWTLLKLLVEGGTTLYYAGDLDPEGLRIADRLKERFEEAVHIWHMDTTAYKTSISQKQLSNERLEKLNGLKNVGLREVAAVMKEAGKAGYQEALVEGMVEEMKRVVLG